MTLGLKRLKYVCSFGYGDALPKNAEPDGSVPVLGSNGRYASFTESNTGAPTIVIGRKGSYGKINWSETECFASDTTFFVDDSRTNENLRWLYWGLQTLKLDEGSGEAAVPGLNRETAYDKRLRTPIIEDQNTIATYLDGETSRIDALVSEKERMLTLIDQKHSVLISRSVTRGLNPKAPTKPSGLDWLGDIPKHWGIERAKNLFSVRDERSEDGGEELLTVSHITGVTSRASKNVNMFLAENMTGYKKCQKDDFVTNTLWAWMGAMGISPLDGIVSPDYHVYKSKGEILPEFMELLCRSKPFVAEVIRWSKGVWSSRLRLYPENFFEIRFPVPPKDEQEAIVADIAAYREKTAKLIEALVDSIQLLKERRSALITAAVTGKIPMEEMSA
jgi:type I restriction enzyme S subunit